MFIQKNHHRGIGKIALTHYRKGSPERFLLQIFIELILMLFLMVPLTAQTGNYRLLNSDEVLIKKNKNGQYTTFLKGNVHFFYGETEFYSDEAIIREAEKTAEMNGRVKAFEDTLAIYAPKAVYYRGEERIVLRDSVYFVENHKDKTVRTLNCRYLEYFRKERNVIAKKNVRAYDEREKLHGFCGYLTYNMNTGYGYLLEKPFVYNIAEDSLSLKAVKIEYFKDYKKIVASFNVETTYAKNRINSDFALYLSEEDEAIFLGNPVFYSDMADAYATEMHLIFDEKNIKEATLLDSCKINFSSEEGKKKENWITSERMRITFNEDSVQNCFAYDNVVSYYKQDEEEKKDFLINNASGDMLTVSINKEDEMESLALNGKVKGVYKFLANDIKEKSSKKKK